MKQLDNLYLFGFTVVMCLMLFGCDNNYMHDDHIKIIDNQLFKCIDQQEYIRIKQVGHSYITYNLMPIPNKKCDY